MPTVGDVIRITSCKELFSQDVCNVFYYAVAAWTGNLTLAQVLDEMQAAEIFVLKSFSTTQLKWGSMRWDNLTDPAEIAEFNLDPPVAGSAAGEALPSSNAYSIQLVRTDLSTRHGYKRFGGVPELFSVGQTQSLTQGQRDAITAFCSDQFVTTMVDQFDPVIVGRTPLGLPDLARINPVASAVFKDELTTQVTRKAGRGS